MSECASDLPLPSTTLVMTSPLIVRVSRTAEETTRQDWPVSGEATIECEASSRDYIICRHGRVRGWYSDRRRRSGCGCGCGIAVVGCVEANGTHAPRPGGQGRPLPEILLFHLLLEHAPHRTAPRSGPSCTTTTTQCSSCEHQEGGVQ